MNRSRMDAHCHPKWAIAFCVCSLILLLSCLYLYLRPAPLSSPPFYPYDTLSRFVLMGIASYLSCLAFRQRTLQIWRYSMPLCPFLMGTFVVLDETLQALALDQPLNIGNVAAGFSGILLFYRLAKARSYLS